MCQYLTLYHNSVVGYVISCTQCHSLQVGFGNLLINLSPKDFDEFRTCISDWKHNYICTNKPSVKSIVIPTPCEGLKLLLSEQELHELYDMLEAADAEWQSVQLLKLFEAKEQ